MLQYINNITKDKNLKVELAFLKTVPPFSDLYDNKLRSLQNRYYLIKSRGVKLYLIDEENMEILISFKRDFSNQKAGSGL